MNINMAYSGFLQVNTVSSDYRRALGDVADQLNKDDVEWLAFRVCGNPSERCTITNGIKLITMMEKCNYVSKKDVTKLLKLLRWRKLNTAAEILQEYQRKLCTENGAMEL